jgi:hypothetical protein
MSTPSEQLTGGIFERIKDFFTSMWTSIFALDPLVVDPFTLIVGNKLTGVTEDWLGGRMHDALVKQLEELNIPDDIKATILKVIKDADFGSMLMGYFFMANYYMSYLGGHASVAGEKAGHEWRKLYRPTLPDAASLILSLYRDPARESEVREMLRQHGYSDPNIDTMFMATKSILSPDDFKNLFLRGEIDEATLNAGYKKYGFTDQEIAHLKTLFYPIPGYPDLVRMAVREAFYPDYIEEYGLLQELPGEFLEYAGKQGLSEDWAKRFWASHWELPSILQGFEMLHRNVITEEQLNSLFMATDIMPWWRDKLQAISYNPLTRVDVRRVFKMGIIDRDQVKRTYLDLGYNEEKAEWLTKFTEMQNTETDRDLTKAEILSSYSKAIIGQSECRNMLLDLGYSEEEVNILISMKEYTTVKEIKDREEKRIRKFYLAGVYTANQTINELGKLDLVGAEQESLLRLWDSEKLAKLKSPTKKELDTLFTASIIGEGIYINEMKNLGYTDKYIEWYLLLIKKAGAED